jgi:hypothetical protein
MDQIDFEELYNDYTHMMLFASLNRPKFKNIKLEIAEIQKIFNEIMKEPPENLLGSIDILKTGLIALENEIKVFLLRYKRISEILRQIDVLISDYYEIDMEISLYELNGMENDLFNVEDEFKEIETLKLNLVRLKKEMDKEIAGLSP